MSLVPLTGHGFWMPNFLGYLHASALSTAADSLLLDADEEEAQFIGHVTIDGGGSKTFGTSSKIGWMVGTATITFAAGATLRVGIKRTSRLDTTINPAHASAGAATFDVWKDLVGGTDTLTALAWRDETMTAGTPFTVTDGDMLAICFHLDVASGTPSVKVRSSSFTGATNFPASTLVTAGPTYTGQSSLPNLLLTFDDGTLGWLDPSKVYSVIDGSSTAIGSGNSWGNIMQVPFACQVDALCVQAGMSNTADCALELYSSPLATPVLLDSLAHDASLLGATSSRPFFKRLPTPRTLAANTPYAVSLKQTTATAISLQQWDVADASHFKPSGLGANCYAANRTGSGNFVAQNSGRRRYLAWMRISALDDGAGASAGGGGAVFGAAGGVIS